MMSSTLVSIFLVATVLTVAGGDRAAMIQEGDASSWCASNAEAEMLQRINDLREENGLDPLELSQPLGAAAELKATDMAEQDYLAHVSPDGQDPEDLLDQVGYTFNTAIGENIAAGQERSEPTFEQWLDSPEHREVMLGEEFTAVGIGRAHNPDADYEWYWAAAFGGEVGELAEACDGATPEASSGPEGIAGT